MHSSRIARNCRALQASSHHISWKPTGIRQQTLASEVCLSGIGLHSGDKTTARLLPAMAGEGRFFVSAFGRSRIPATIEHAVNSPLCTTLCRGGARVRTVEHLLSALEACGVDNCRIEIDGGDETGIRQQTLASEVCLSGIGLHSGDKTTARLLPAMAGEGRFFVSAFGRSRIPATIEHAVNSPLCTTLCRGGARVRTVEHLLSALEACGVDNCRIEIDGGDEVPFLDGSAKHWVEAIVHVGMCEATDFSGNTKEKMAPVLCSPKYVCKGDSFIVALPSSKFHITYGINFPKVPAIGCQWFSCSMDGYTYSKEIASSRSFCIYEEIQQMRDAGLIQGGSIENAIVCSAVSGWLNPPLRFYNEPCRHKILDLIGDFSLLSQNGHQGLPFSHLIAYKAGHSLHVDFVRRLANISGENLDIEKIIE